MAKRLRKRIALAQNFFCCAEQVRALVAASTLDSTDTIVEIGPGEGMLTQELAKVAHRVVAVEKDATLVASLRQRFR
jgi:16S rRNA A1518/A1519 N6-dimethyltransferase RsmA/KsgA/DIM1 with predicted DNA glycosylase/AP lyase activity